MIWYITKIYSDEVKKLLPSLRYYNQLNGSSDMGLKRDCYEINNNMDDIIAFINICMNITGAMEMLDLMNHFHIPVNNKCTSFILWIYDYVIKEINNDNGYIKTKRVINKINDILQRNSSTKECDVLKYSDIEIDLDKLRTLNDYVNDYKTIEQYINDSNYKCSKKLSDYIYIRRDLYNSIKFQCIDKKGDRFCEAFNDLINNSYSNYFTNVLCLELDNKRIEYITMQNFQNHSVGNHLNKEFIDKKASAIFRKSTKAIVGVITFMFIFLLILFILYKFSPFRTWKYKILKKIKREWNNLDKTYEYGTSGYLSKSELLNLMRNPINISYIPS
ncbi:variable surface protein [Plasmodium gonderi]|uniref:Variable surface protein n=1 Tax=Plasmodium gonderi TaxID=77519 RepID=A0A1Y1JWY9_PLAGO|nr:variable surface protein [Plasmodium gonderi]GAW84334.1 variable surface protein [Plasmodium gonderi]